MTQQRDCSKDDAMVARPYACPLPHCARRFKRRFTLKEHVKTHTGEKAFICPVPSCHKRFTTSGNLSRHKRLHPWLETTFECLIVGCGCTFATEAKLERHVRMAHFGLSTHICPRANCGGAFSTAGNLKRHLRHHHPDEEDDKMQDDPMQGPTTPIDSASPVAVDRFEHVAMGTPGFVFAWGMPPPPPPTLPPVPVFPSLHQDHDLLEALGCLFEPEP